MTYISEKQQRQISYLYQTKRDPNTVYQLDCLECEVSRLVCEDSKDLAREFIGEHAFHEVRIHPSLATAQADLPTVPPVPVIDMGPIAGDRMTIEGLIREVAIIGKRLAMEADPKNYNRAKKHFAKSAEPKLAQCRHAWKGLTLLSEDQQNGHSQDEVLSILINLWNVLGCDDSVNGRRVYLLAIAYACGFDEREEWLVYNDQLVSRMKLRYMDD